MKVFLMLLPAAGLLAQKAVPLPSPTVTGQQPGVSEPNATLDWRIQLEKKAASKKAANESRPAQAKAPADFSLGLKTLIPGPLTLPSRNASKLANGLTVHLVENRELPRVEAILMAHGGSVHDVAEKAGLSAIAMNALREGGTKTNPGEGFARALDSAGVSLTAEAGPRNCLIRLRAEPQAAAQALEFLRDLVLAPEYDMAAVDTVLGRYRAGVAGRNRRIQDAVAREFSRAVYGPGIAQGRVIEFQNIDNIDRGDLLNFHRRALTPANSVLIVEGDFSAPEMQARVATLFGSWSGPPVSRQPVAPFHAAPSPGVRYIEHRESRRSVFAIGHLGGTFQDPDFASMLLLAEILGGGGPSRLRQLAQSQQRWEAAFGAAWQADSEPGLFRISGSVAQWATTDAIAAVLAEIDKLATQPPSAAELEDARNRLLANVAARYSRPLPALLDTSVHESLGMPAGSIPAMYQQIATADRASVAAAAKRRLRATDCLIVVAGSETLFDRPLASLNRKVTPLDIAPPPPKPIEPKTDAASVAAGKAWIERMRKALGGDERLAKIEQSSLRYEGKIWFGANPVDSKRTDRWMKGGVYRQDVETSAGRTIVFYNGTIGWITDRRGLAPLSVPVQKQVRGELFRVLFRLALSDRDDARTVSHLGANMVSVSNAEGDAVRLYFDEETALPQRIAYWTADGAGSPMSVEENLLDWKDVDGVKLPGRVIVKQNGARFEDSRLAEAKFSGMSLAELEKKP